MAIAEKHLDQPAARESPPHLKLLPPAQARSEASLDLTEHRDWMMRRARAKLSNHQEAEDVVQETLFKVWRASAEVEILNARAYLLRTLDRNIIARYRSAGARERLIERCLRERASESSDTALGIEEQERCLQVRAALETLAPRQRRALELLADGMKIAQIAEAMRTHPRSVTVLVIRGKGKLRAELLRSGFVPSLLALLPMDSLRRLRWRLNRMVHHLESFDLALWQATASAVTVAAIGLASAHDLTVDLPKDTKAAEVQQAAHSLSTIPVAPSVNPKAEIPKVDNAITKFLPQGGPAPTYSAAPREEKGSPPGVIEQLSAILSDPRRVLPSCGGVITCP